MSDIALFSILARIVSVIIKKETLKSTPMPASHARAHARVPIFLGFSEKFREKSWNQLFTLYKTVFRNTKKRYIKLTIITLLIYMEWKHGTVECPDIPFSFTLCPLMSFFGIFSLDGFLDGFLDGVAELRHNWSISPAVHSWKHCVKLTRSTYNTTPRVPRWHAWDR